jgi:ACS family hexuronate transporter-like MFS transporter
MIRLTGRVRWAIVGLLFLFPVVNMLDRNSLAVLAPMLSGPLGLTTVHYSYVYMVFLTAYAIGYVFAGRLLDRLGVKIGLGIALAAWSLISLGHALIAGWVGFLVLRFLLGLAESLSAPAGLKALAEWIPSRERSLSIALFSSGNSVGQILATPLVAFVAVSYGWRWSFVAIGGLGLLVLLAWWKWYDAPETHPRLGNQEREMILRERSIDGEARRGDFLIRELLKDPLWIGFFVSRFLTDNFSFFFAGWLPAYFANARGISLGALGLIGWLPYLLGNVGGFGGGALSDWLVRRGMPPVRARFAVMLGVVCFMPLANVAVRTSSLALCVLLMGGMYAGQVCWMVNQLAMLSECYPRQVVGTMVSISAIGGSLGGVVGTLLIGRAVHAAGYVPVFTTMSVLHAAAFVALLICLRHRPSSAVRSGVFGLRQPAA